MSLRRKPKSQSSFIERTSDRFGGLDTQGRERTTMGSRQLRPISTSTSMHVILKSKRAVGKWSFLYGNHRKQIQNILKQTAATYGVRIYSGANVGNHIHLHIKLTRRWQYLRFIRVATAKIAFLVTKANKFSPIRDEQGQKISLWSQRPVTRFVHSFKDFLGLRDYIRINHYEGLGWSRAQAEFFVSSA